MNRKIKILGIAPYESLKTSMEKIVETRSDIQLTAFVGNLDEGVAISKKYTASDFDIIISRGGTADLLQKSTSIPVVEIQLSVYDILRAIKLSENYSNKYAIVGYQGITKHASYLCNLLQYEIDIYTLHDVTEIPNIFSILREKGYQMVLCDMITNSFAKQNGISSILITSGTESIETAFDQAVETFDFYSKLKKHNVFLNTILQSLPISIAVYNEEGELVSSSNQTQLPSLFMDELANNIPIVIKDNKKFFLKRMDDKLLRTTGTTIELNQQKFVTYYVQVHKNHFAKNQRGIQYLNKEMISSKSYDGFYSLSDSSNLLFTSIQQFNETSYPLFITGEVGTGKNHMAQYIYTQSTLKNKPLIIINPDAFSNDNEWSFLTNNENSPLSEIGVTIYFRDVQTLPKNRLNELLQIIKNSELYKSNRLIFTFSHEEGVKLPDIIIQFMNDTLSLSLHVLPLRFHPEDIPSLTSLYISSMNLELGKELVGFEPGAIELIKSFSWPHNYNQIKRVLNELAIMSTSMYIKYDDVKAILNQEMLYSAKDQSNIKDNNINLNQSLEKINLDIVKQILKEESGNQSNTAKRLEISRTTLWRMIQKIEQQ